MCDCQGSVPSPLFLLPSTCFVSFLLSPDNHTLQQTLGPLRAARGLIAQSGKPLVDWPSPVSWWNKVQGPVDSTSQYLATLADKRTAPTTTSPAVNKFFETRIGKTFLRTGAYTPINVRASNCARILMCFKTPVTIGLEYGFHCVCASAMALKAAVCSFTI